jgi:hypothetical protein
MSGILMGLGLGSLLTAWVASTLTGKFEAVSQQLGSVAATTVVGATSATLASLVGGIVLLALGMIMEVYCRAKSSNAPS